MKLSLEGGRWLPRCRSWDGHCRTASETGSRGVHSNRNRLDTRAGSIVRQEKTGNVNFPDGFVRFGLGLYWFLLCRVSKTGSHPVALAVLEFTAWTGFCLVLVFSFATTELWRTRVDQRTLTAHVCFVLTACSCVLLECPVECSPHSS